MTNNHCKNCSSARIRGDQTGPQKPMSSAIPINGVSLHCVPPPPTSPPSTPPPAHQSLTAALVGEEICNVTSSTFIARTLGRYRSQPKTPPFAHSNEGLEGQTGADKMSKDKTHTHTKTYPNTMWSKKCWPRRYDNPLYDTSSAVHKTVNSKQSRPLPSMALPQEDMDYDNQQKWCHFTYPIYLDKHDPLPPPPHYTTNSSTVHGTRYPHQGGPTNFDELHLGRTPTARKHCLKWKTHTRRPEHSKAKNAAAN